MAATPIPWRAVTLAGGLVIVGGLALDDAGFGDDGLAWIVLIVLATLITVRILPAQIERASDRPAP